MIRIIAGGPGFKDYAHNEYVDRYVKIVFPQPGVDYEPPLDLWAIRESMPREQWPHTRTYTIRWVNLEAQELAIDFVVHGDEGLAGPWAAAAEPGDALTFTGPGVPTIRHPTPTGTSLPGMTPRFRRSPRPLRR